MKTVFVKVKVSIGNTQFSYGEEVVEQEITMEIPELMSSNMGAVVSQAAQSMYIQIHQEFDSLTDKKQW